MMVAALMAGCVLPNIMPDLFHVIQDVSHSMH